MKHFTLTTAGTPLWSRNARAVTLLFAMLAVIAVFATPAPAVDDFPFATRVEIVGPMTGDLHPGTSVPDFRPIYDLPNCPQWATDLIPTFGKNAEGYTANMLQFLNTFNRSPFFTPDGKWIVFDDNVCDAWMVPSGGGEPRLGGQWYFSEKLDENGGIIGGMFGIWRICGISPDGKEVLVVKKMCREGDQVMVPVGPGFTVLAFATELVSRNIETGVETLISKDATMGRWSHDGSMIAFVKRDPAGNPSSNSWSVPVDVFENIITGLYIKNVATGEERQIAGKATRPCFVPDDSAIICSMKDTNGLWQIFRIPVEGGDPTQLTFFGKTDNGRNARVNDVSPDGQWVVFTGESNAGAFDVRPGLWVFNTTLGKSYPLFPESAWVTAEGSWSPDGSRIVFAAHDGILEWGEDYWAVHWFAIYTADFNAESIMNPTAVAEALPSGFAISGNYPNPFNPSTTISFSLPATGTASLAVYDITGRKVRDLVNGQLSRGAHSAVWDGRDSEGRVVSTGVYLSRLTMNGKNATSRMLLVK
jgi:Tol biopolymer transport system component